jgi:hypothetical protein
MTDAIQLIATALASRSNIRCWLSLPGDVKLNVMHLRIWRIAMPITAQKFSLTVRACPNQRLFWHHIPGSKLKPIGCGGYQQRLGKIRVT